MFKYNPQTKQMDPTTAVEPDKIAIFRRMRQLAIDNATNNKSVATVFYNASEIKRLKKILKIKSKG